MRSFALVAAFAALAVARPQGVTADITPTAAAPAGCTNNFPLFELSVVNASTAGSKAKRQSDTLEIKLVDGILTDSAGRRGYVAANQQFQFDAPPIQDGAIYTGGFTVCSNNTLALGDSAVWYECLSGKFYNLYEENTAAQCHAIFLDAIKVSDGSISVSTAAATTTSDGQVGASTAASTAVSAVTSSAAVVTSITDNQPQGPTTTTAVTSSIEVVTSSAAVVSSISDHQIQAPTTATGVTSSIEVVSATTSVALVTSISDHQIQAPTSASAVTSATSVELLSTISDHQVQAPTSASVLNATYTTASLTAYTGGASAPTMVAQFLLAAAGVAAAVL